jgi:hypothetical protein
MGAVVDEPERLLAARVLMAARRLSVRRLTAGRLLTVNGRRLPE